MPQDVPSTSDRHLIELENQVQRLMEAHLAPNQPVQVNKIASSCEICSGPHDTQYCMENPEQAFVEYASSRTNEAGGLMSNFMASQDAKISRFEADFKQYQSKMTNKLDTFLKAFNDQMTGALPSDMVKNLNLNPNSTSSTLNTLTVNEIEIPTPQGPEKDIKDEFTNLHLNLPLEVLAHVPIYDALLDKYIVSLELEKNRSEYIQSVAPENIKDPELFILPCRLGDSKTFDTIADLGSCVNLIPLNVFKKLKIGLLKETDDVLGLADGTKSYPVGIMRNVEVHVGKLKLFEDFHVVDMEREPTCPLLIGRGFLAITNAVIDCKKAKIVVGEGLTRSIFRVRELDFGEDNVPYWTTIGKRESYKPRTSEYGIALDEGFSSKNYVRKFLRALHPKWRAKVTAIKELKYLSSLALDELIENLKVHEVVIKKDSEIYRGKKERIKSIALKAKKESNDDETSTSRRDDEEYAMVIRNFKRCGDPNHLIGDYPKPSRNKDQKAFIGGSWSDSENDAEDKTNDETCLMAQSSNEVTLNSSYYIDNASSLDNDSMQIEYDSLCEISLKIISKNKILKTKRDLLEKEILELNEKNEKIKKLEKSKEIEIACKSCEELKSENAKLKETQIKFVKFDKSANSLREMLNNQKSPSCKIGLGFDSSKASTSETKIMSFVESSAEKVTDGSTMLVSVCLRTSLEPDEWIKDSGCSKHMTGNKSLFSTYKAYDREHVDNLAFNLLSVGQICDNKCQVLFTKEGSEIIKDGKIIGNRIRKNGLYVMKLGNKSQDKLCLATVVDNSTLWHRRLGHANMRLIQSLSSKELVRNLPKLKYDKHFCDACKIRKQAHASHKAKNIVSTKRCLELLHMDLFGPSAIKSYGGNLYTLVVVDDYSRYTWTRFLKTKNEAFEKFEILSRKIQNQLGSSIIAIRTDHGREFDNEVQFGAYCDAQGITHNFSAPRTPQSNGVVERKNRTLQEMSRTMLNEQSIPQKFWCNAVDTSTYILNRILIRPILGKTPYEIFRGRKPSLEYFKVFGSKCFILNTKDYLTKFDPKSYEGVFLGYSQNSKAYVVLNKHTMKVEESLNVTFDESPPPTKLSPLVDDDVGEEEAIKTFYEI
ncbi:retrovirus-related pol polyprotein from transposon TNT 1-94 [Tanacetum coccineum]